MSRVVCVCVPHVSDISESILALIPTKYVLDFWPGLRPIKTQFIFNIVAQIDSLLSLPHGNENFLFSKPCNKLFDTCSGAEIVYKLFVACATLFFMYFKAQQKKEK